MIILTISIIILILIHETFKISNEIDKKNEIISYLKNEVIQNIKNILEDAGSSWENMVDVTVYLTNMKKGSCSDNFRLNWWILCKYL
jgi:hypothetical protein